MNLYMTLSKQKHAKKDQGGYTLLFAVLTSALVLGVAVFILGVSRKQYELSVAARNSSYSFYAADSGIDCAALAYTNGNIATSTGATVACYNQILTSSFAAVSSGFPSFLSNAVYPVYKTQQVSGSYLNFALRSGCFDLIIYDGYDTSGVHWTVIDSRGYNYCATVGGLPNSPDTSNPATVERALRLGKQG